MRILVLGGGTVGGSIAEVLCQQRHKVTIVEKNPDVAEQLDTELDVNVVVGSASESSVLFQASGGSADLCLALTGNDECNIVAASMAKEMGATRVAARVYAKIFRDLSTFDYQSHFRIDRLLSSEHLTAMELARRIRDTTSITIEYFARGQIEMQDVIIMRSSHATDRKLYELQLPPEARIGAIWRNGKTFIPTASDVVEVGDRMSLLGDQDKLEEVKKMFYIQSFKKQSVIIAGGGETGQHLAQVLSNRHYSVTIMDANKKRCENLASAMREVTVVHANALRRNDLEEEGIGGADIFIACTGDDEDNIMACVEAEALGAKKRMAVVTRSDYANVISRLGINEIVSPRSVMTRQVIGLLNTGPIVFRNSSLVGGGIEVLEIEVQKDAPVTQGTLKEVVLPPKTLLAAILREGFTLLPNAKSVLQQGDTVVAFAHAETIIDLVAAFTAPKN
ncbi:MAG: Trk system potassium transporter TrkA [Planctomycetaceae bacterium]|jgi:trk system potassium uptake protein TrkA|nr:Trk system potassium transporter TrkA [Planctomycetaceae bacterium]